MRRSIQRPSSNNKAILTIMVAKLDSPAQKLNAIENLSPPSLQALEFVLVRYGVLTGKGVSVGRAGRRGRS
jgi:hypothetical protein